MGWGLLVSSFFPLTRNPPWKLAAAAEADGGELDASGGEADGGPRRSTDGDDGAHQGRPAALTGGGSLQQVRRAAAALSRGAWRRPAAGETGGDAQQERPAAVRSR
jgi:hypothetical protein